MGNNVLDITFVSIRSDQHERTNVNMKCVNMAFYFFHGFIQIDMIWTDIFHFEWCFVVILSRFSVLRKTHCKITPTVLLNPYGGNWLI